LRFHESGVWLSCDASASSTVRDGKASIGAAISARTAASKSSRAVRDGGSLISICGFYRIAPHLSTAEAAAHTWAQASRRDLGLDQRPAALSVSPHLECRLTGSARLLSRSSLRRPGVAMATKGGTRGSRSRTPDRNERASARRPFARSPGLAIREARPAPAYPRRVILAPLFSPPSVIAATDSPFAWGWDAFVAIGTLGLASGTFWLAFLTRRLATASRDDERSRWRPVLVSGTDQSVSHEEGTGMMRFQLRNVGRGPALGLNAQLRSGIVGYGSSLGGRTVSASHDCRPRRDRLL
jgi:hypothetical protein